MALRITSGSAEVLAVKPDQIEGIEERTVVLVVVPQSVQVREAVVIASDCLAVEDTERERNRASAPTMRGEAIQKRCGLLNCFVAFAPR